MPTMVFRTESQIKEDEFIDFFEKKKWGDRTYPFVDRLDPSSLAKLANLSYWKENDRLEREIYEKTGVSPDDQALLDEMPDEMKKGWIDFANKLAAISDAEIESALLKVVAKVPDFQPKDPAVWRVYFKMKRDYIKAIVAANIIGVEVYI